MQDEIISRNAILITISLLIFSFFSFFSVSYYTKKSLEDQLINVTDIVANQIMKTETTEALYEVVDTFTTNQTWLHIQIATSYGFIEKDSDNDAVGTQITNYLNQKELDIALKNLPKERVYVESKNIYYIIKLTDDMILRTSVVFEKNLNYITLTLGIAIALLLVMIFVNIFFSKITSQNVVNTFLDIKKHLKEINDGTYSNLSMDAKYEEVEPLLEEIDEINNNIYSSMQKIKNEHDKYNFIINNMNQGILIVSKEGRVLLVNDYARRVLNIKEKNIDAIRLVDIFFQKNMLDLIQGEFISKEPTSFDFKTNGKIYQFNLSYVEDLWFKTEVGGLEFILITNVTVKRNNDEMKAQFISNASHELKTPITSIRGFSELLLSDKDALDALTGKYIEIIYKESIKMKKTVDDLLFLSNLEYHTRNDLNKNCVHFEVASLVNEILNSLNEQIEKMNLDVFVSIDESIKLFENEQLVLHLLENLISNAVRYNKEYGKIYIEAEVIKEGILSLTIADTGIGIAEENLYKIFERFFRVDESRNSKGTGIGLNIVKQICDIIDAKIKVSSTLGVGTKFIVDFKIKE